MVYVSAEARQELLDSLAEAADELASALAALGGAYEALDEHTADALEEELFRPVQSAYGRAKRAYSEFAARHGHEDHTFAPGTPGPPSLGPQGYLTASLEALDQCEAVLSELQDSMLPVEVGDPEIRAGLAEVRTLVGDALERGERFAGRIGR